MIVKCIRRCWDSGRNRRYHPGDQDDIDPLEPIAGNFDFPPGTEIYWKKPGNKTTPAESTTRIVGEAVVEKKQIRALESEEELLKKRLESIRKQKESLLPKEPENVTATCDKCGEYTGTTKQVHMHSLTCKGKKTE